MAERKGTYIDPIFWAPEDVVDFIPVSADDDLNDAYVTEDSEYESNEDGLDTWEETPLEDGAVTDVPGALPTLDSYTVIEQTMRVAADGTHVVDITIVVDDYPGISEYNVRMTRA